MRRMDLNSHDEDPSAAQGFEAALYFLEKRMWFQTQVGSANPHTQGGSAASGSVASACLDTC